MTLRVAKIQICKRHAKMLYLALEKEFGQPQAKEMPWHDEIKEEKERSKWWK